MKDKRNIIVTGANSGIGLACVKQFIENGDRVIAIVRNKESKTELLDSLRNKNSLDIHYLDLEDSNDLKINLNKIINMYKNIDVLVNNAGKIFNGLVQMTSKDKFADLFSLNFYAPLELIQNVSKKMIRSKKGSIINVSSTSSEDCNVGRSAYSSSKAALESLTKTLAFELGPFNIRANCILPGLTNTKLMIKNTDAKILEQVVKNISLGRIAETQEIAHLVTFLASEQSSYITAQTIRIDGGMRR